MSLATQLPLIFIRKRVNQNYQHCS